MYYTAKRTLKAWDHVNKCEVEYQAGDVIPDFELWNQAAQRSNLNIDWVEKHPGDVPAGLKTGKVVAKEVLGEPAKKAAVKPKKKASKAASKKPKKQEHVAAAQ